VCVVVYVVKCDNVAIFLGRKLGGWFKDELGLIFIQGLWGLVLSIMGFVVKDV